MSDVPRIVRKPPFGRITQAPQPVPVIADIEWADGRIDQVPAIVCAWTRDAVQIFWEAPEQGLRSDWIAASAVHRSPLSPLRPRDDPPGSGVRLRTTKG